MKISMESIFISTLLLYCLKNSVLSLFNTIIIYDSRHNANGASFLFSCKMCVIFL